MAEDRGVEPHPISQNPVFKAGRRTNPAALSSISLVPNSEFESLTYRLSSECSTAELIGNNLGGIPSPLFIVQNERTHLVLPSRIELLSEDLQSPAMTTSAKAASILWGDYWELNPDKRNHNPRLYH